MTRGSAGDPHDVETLFDRYASVVFSLALRIVRDKVLAEEILDEVFFRAWRRWQEPHSVRGTILSWLIEMTRAVAIEVAYDRRTAIGTSEADAKAGPADPEALDIDAEPDAWVREIHQAVIAALDALPADHRRAIELAYFEGLSEEEIAGALHVPVETVRTSLNQATRVVGEAVRKVRRP